MSEYACCPKCGYGGEDAEFYELNLAWFFIRILPIVDESGEIEVSYIGVPDADLSTLGTPDEFGVDLPRYLCPSCGERFDEFVIMELEDETDEAEDIEGDWG